MAYTEAQARALMLTHLNGVTTGGNWESADLLSHLNIALKKVARVAPSDLLGTLAQSTNVTVLYVASPTVPSANLISGLLKYTNMSLEGVPVSKKSLSKLDEEYSAFNRRPFRAVTPSDTQLLEESQFYAVHDKIYFFPRYAATKNYTLKYVKTPADLTLGSPTPMECHDALCDTVIFLATRMALQQDGRLDAAAVINQLLDAEINSVVKTYGIETQDFAFPMVPGQPAERKTG